MAYSGFLIKIGDYIVPFKYIEAKKYKTGIKGQDLDSYRDSNGILHRNALKNVSIKTEWEVPSDLEELELRTLMDNINKQYVNSVEKKSLVTVYAPEIGKYVSMYCYEPDIEYTIDYADESTIKYSSFRIAFVGYGGVAE